MDKNNFPLVLLLDPGWIKIRIQDKHPGSATLVNNSTIVDGMPEFHELCSLWRLFLQYAASGTGSCPSILPEARIPGVSFY